MKKLTVYDLKNGAITEYVGDSLSWHLGVSKHVKKRFIDHVTEKKKGMSKKKEKYNLVKYDVSLSFALEIKSDDKVLLIDENGTMFFVSLCW